MSLLEVDATGQMVLKSPMAGIVVARDAVPGAVIEAGAAALTVTDPSSMWLEFGAPDRVAALLTPGIWSTQPVLSLIEHRGGCIEPQVHQQRSKGGGSLWSILR